MKQWGFKTMFFYKGNIPVKNHGFKSIVFYRDFEEAFKGLIRPLRALYGPQGPYKALNGLIRPSMAL